MDRYLSFSQYLKNTFHRRLYKVSLNAHMTCPNRDGTCGDRGCIFCSAAGSGDFAISFNGEALKREDLVFNHQKCDDGFIAYFQSFTNTYAPIEKLERIYRAALENELFAGISIATRPDCMQQEVIDLLVHLQKEYPSKFIWVELGLQTIHEKTALWMRRGYPLSVFDHCTDRLHEAGFPVIVHVIIGLPGENEEMLYQTIEYLNSRHIEGIKLQLLHYLKDSDLGQEYLAHPDRYHPLEIDEYIDLVCGCIARLDPSIVIHRISGDGNKGELLAPLWSMDKRNVINQINHALKEKNIVQGCMIK